LNSVFVWPFFFLSAFLFFGQWVVDLNLFIHRFFGGRLLVGSFFSFFSVCIFTFAGSWLTLTQWRWNFTWCFGILLSLIQLVILRFNYGWSFFHDYLLAYVWLVITSAARHGICWRVLLGGEYFFHTVDVVCECLKKKLDKANKSWDLPSRLLC
jgi:hypothetical protein